MSQTPEEVTTLAYNWTIQRPDGAGFGATSHDSRKVKGATTFEPDLDLKPGELLLDDGMFASRLRVEGGISSSALSAADLFSGRWQGAGFRLDSSDWAQDDDRIMICEGEIAETQIDGSQLSISIDLLPAALREPPCIQTSPECRAVLGDRQCRVSLRSRRLRVEVVALDGDAIVVNADDTERFRMGRLRWISGSNCGVDQMVIASDGGRLSLHDSVRRTVAVGDRALLTEGCDGRRTTCSERFGNILNFRGEPDLPGSEILMRFPGA